MQSPPGGCQLERTRSPEYSLNRLPRMGVPGNGNNLSHGTSPQVPSTGRRTRVDRTRGLAQVPRYSKANGNSVRRKPVSRSITRQGGQSRPCRDALACRDLNATLRSVATTLRSGTPS
ncbi:hypothetical protein Taro_008861 [Colocasia esculenta]|uniref:Uncharacterized protein n=1 Tax=Colocasia esculenta TaxID=4460 RepID=A0A843U4Q7_COLES|nr:hypothetical protein [Colocasia esculenta]